MLRSLLLKSCLAAFLCLVSLGTPARADESTRVDVPAGDLITALKSLTRQSGIDLVYRSDQLEGLTTRGVNGTLSAREAVTKLLEGTLLEVTTDASGAILISRPPVGGDVRERTGPYLARNHQAGVSDAPQAAGDAARTAGGDRPASSAGNPGALSGRVTDQAVGRNLPGAIVRIEGTQLATQTDEFGRFHFAGLPPGNYLLSISYLGYQPIDALVVVNEGETASAEFQLGFAAQALDDVVVFGARSARALALNQQRTAENSSSIISDDMLGNFTGTTISEALRRVEGITLVRDPVTGDGTNVVIRGLEPDLNNIQLNGVNLPGGFQVTDRSSSDRSADLSFLLADSVSKVTVNKSLLPSHDSAGTGGLIEIETKSPLDRPHRYANFSVESGRKADNFGDDLLLSGTVSGTFGSERSFGLSAAMQYRERRTKNFQYNMQLYYGPFQPLDEEGLPSEMTMLDPRVTYPFDPLGNRAFPIMAGHSLMDVEATTLGVTLSGAWQPNDTTSLRLDLTRASDQRDTFMRTSSFGAGGESPLVPVAALGGEQRYMLGWDGSTFMQHTYRSFRDVESISDTATFNGKTSVGRFDFDYTLGYGKGSNDNPEETYLNLIFDSDVGGYFDPAFVGPGAVDPVEGRIISVFGERTGRGFPVPHFSEEGFDFFNDTGNYVALRRFGQRISSGGYNRKGTANLSARYTPADGVLGYVELGGHYERSKFGATGGRSFDIVPLCGTACMSAADLGLVFDEPGLSAIGRPERGFSVISRGSFERFASRLERLGSRDGSDFQLVPLEQDPRIFDQYTEEDSLAIYLQGRLNLGRWEIIGGPRMNRVDVLTARLSYPQVFDESFLPDMEFQEQYTKFLNLRAVSTDVLPRVLVNFRQSDNLIFRGGYFQSVARPSVTDLSSEQSIALFLSEFAGSDPLGTTFGPLLSAYQGNPGLRPTVTENFDLSVEYYKDELGLIRVSAFYKLSDDLIEANLTRTFNDLEGLVLPDHPYFAPENLPDNLIVEFSQPVNSPYSASLWGIEAGIERQFTFLPGAWSGLGVFANVTYTDSSKSEDYDWVRPFRYDENGLPVSGGDRVVLRIDDTPYGAQSAWSGTAAVTYNRAGIDASLAYSVQTRASTGWQPYGLGTYDEGADTLDLRIARQFAWEYCECTLSFEGIDLLKGVGDPDLETTVGGVHGMPKSYVGAGFIGGREFRLGWRMAF